MAETHEQRSLRARVAVHTSWARTPDRTARTAPGNKALMQRFEREVDPNFELSPEERAKRAESARKAYFSRLSAKSVAARKRRKANREAQLNGPARNRQESAGNDTDVQ